MTDALDLSSKKQRQEAEAGVAEKICSEYVPALFYDFEKRAWIRLPVDGHLETFPVDSEEMAHVLRKAFWEQTKRDFEQPMAMPKKLLKEKIEFLSSMALFEGEQRTISLRVGAPQPRILYVDLCDTERRVVRISPAGWKIEKESAVYFRRSVDMLALPVPVRGGSAEELAPFLNLPQEQLVLVIGWLLAALRSRGPYPLLALIGPAGSAKSSFARFLRALVDPDRIPIAGPPRDVRDLNVASLNSHCLAFDNISSLSQALSDGLCRIATGGGIRERKLFTNREQSRFPSFSRPVIVNGVGEFITAPDLLDRSIVLHLQHLDSKQTEASMEQNFNAARSRIFGGLLDLMSEGVRNLPSAPVQSSSRMAEAITWATACGLTNFESRYQENLREANQSRVEFDPLAVGIKGLMKSRKTPWTGTMTDLSRILKNAGHEIPDHLQTLSEDLRKIAPALRTGLGLAVEFKRLNKERRIRISKVQA
jgi:hypothetical protein